MLGAHLRNPLRGVSPSGLPSRDIEIATRPHIPVSFRPMMRPLRVDSAKDPYAKWALHRRLMSNATPMLRFFIGGFRTT